MPVLRALAFLPILIAVSLQLSAQQLEPLPAPVAPPSPSWTDWLGQAGSTRIRARLTDDSQLANHSVSIEVEVQNVFLNFSDPGPGSGIQRGVLRYQLDQCPMVITTATQLRFDQLPSGEHIVAIAAISSYNRPLTPEAKVHLKIP